MELTKEQLKRIIKEEVTRQQISQALLENLHAALIAIFENAEDDVSGEEIIMNEVEGFLDSVGLGGSARLY